MTELHQASTQWANRPDDERFLTLPELRNAVARRRRESFTVTATNQDVRVKEPEGSELELIVPDKAAGVERVFTPSHWSFGQVAQVAKVPATYLREIPSWLAAANLSYGLQNSPRGEHLLLGRDNGGTHLSAVTSTSYGRIWDQEVVDAVIKVNADGNWTIPPPRGYDPLQATTLYASDRDVFIFLVDEQHPIDVKGDTLFRGFFAWNSEVGKASFGLMTFLYRYVCMNRIVWGATNVQELRVRHTSGAPDRFAYEGQRYLTRYANESTQAIEGTIHAAKQKEIGKNDGEIKDFLKKRGFTQKVAASAIAKAEEEEGGAGSLWNVVQGLTASARSIEHTDTRVDLERKAGKLLELAT